MEIEVVKELLAQRNVNKDNYFEILKSVTSEISESNLSLFVRSLGYFDKFYTDEIFFYVITSLDKFKNDLPSTDHVLSYYYYGCALVHTYLGDRSRCLEYGFELKKLKDVDPVITYCVESFMVSSLYAEGLYNEALAENDYAYKTLSKTLSDKDLASIFFNYITIYCSMNDHDKFMIYLNKLYDALGVKSLLDMNQEIYYFMYVLTVLAFDDKYTSKEIVENTIKDYVSKAFCSDYFDQSFSYIDIHITILKQLLLRNRRDEIKRVCRQYISTRGYHFDSDMCKLYLESIDRRENLYEYQKALEIYVQSLESKGQFEKSHIKHNYERFNYLNTIGNDYSKLKNNYMHDPLTGCFSRANYEQERRTRRFGSLIYIDINKLKTVNDTYGHQFGDKYIKRFAQNLKRAMPDDNIYRIGGDEFIVISDEMDDYKIKEKLDKLDSYSLYMTENGDKFSAGIYVNKGFRVTVINAEKIADDMLYDIKGIKGVYYKFKS